jgi:acyl-coenzyme A thioesterase PaaI-like protein
VTSPSPAELTLEQIQALVTRAPFHQWLGLTVVAVSDDGIEIRAKWRDEWVVNKERGYTHGGILAALVDLAADWAMVKSTGRRMAKWCAAARNSPPPRRRSST